MGSFTDPSTGLLTPRVWSNAPITFDNLWYAIVAIFVVITLDDWPTLMFQAMDAVGVGKQPRPNHQIWASIYFLFLLLMGSIFWANLLAGVVTDCYSKLPPEDKDMLFITESQKRWAQAIKMKRYENQETMHNSAPPSVRRKDHDRAGMINRSIPRFNGHRLFNNATCDAVRDSLQSDPIDKL